MGFSKWLVANQMLAFVINRSDVFVIGKLAGTVPVGFYTIGNEIARLATTELVMPFNRVLLPGYAKVAHDTRALRSAYVSALALIVLVAFPVAVGIALVAEPMVWVLLGEKWMMSVPIIQVLTIAGVASVLRANSHPMLLAMGLPHLTTVINSVVAVAIVPLLLWLTSIGGALGAAGAVSAAAVLGVLMNFVVIMRVIDLSIRDVTSSIWRSVVSVAVMIAATRATMNTFDSDLAALTGGTAAGAVTYVATHFALWRFSGSPVGAESKLLELYRSRFSHRSAAQAN